MRSAATIISPTESKQAIGIDLAFAFAVAWQKIQGRRPVMHKELPVKIIIMILAVLIMSPITTRVFSQETPSQVNIDPDQLKSFARVYVQFEKIRDIYLPRIKSAQNARETDGIEKEARARIAEVLKKEGLTPESYSHIVKEINADVGLRAKAMQLIDEERKKS